MGLPQLKLKDTPERRALALLASVRDGETERPLSLDLHDMYLAEADLSGMDLSGYDLSGADLSRADLSGATLAGATLAGATLFETQLDGADLSGAGLREAHMLSCSARRAGFGQADLQDAVLMSGDFSEASFTQGHLTGADLHAACLRGARLREADLTGAELSGADLRDADLSESTVTGAHFCGTDLQGATLSGIRDYQRASWVRADMRGADFTGAYLLRRFAMDQNYLEEYRTQNATHEWLYRIWWLTSDCGRDIGRWGLLTIANTVFFALTYTQVGIDYGAAPTWLSPLYFSVVTLTTLGFGDVLPSSVGGQITVIAQVLCGYVMLGGMMAIISNKMARRAD